MADRRLTNSTCEVCGEQCQRSWGRSRCKRHRSHQQHICPTCGKQYWARSSTGSRRYCSSACTPVTCLFCGERFYGHRKSKYCSKEHKQQAHHKPKVQWDCVECGTIVIRDSGPPGKYCDKHKNSNQNKDAAHARRQAIIKQSSTDPDLNFNSRGQRRRTRQRLADRDGWVCGICRKRIDKNLKYPDPMSATIDHIVPLMDHGPHDESNLRLAHLRCNTIRGNRMMAELGLMIHGDMGRFREA